MSALSITISPFLGVVEVYSVQCNFTSFPSQAVRSTYYNAVLTLTLEKPWRFREMFNRNSLQFLRLQYLKWNRQPLMRQCVCDPFGNAKTDRLCFPARNLSSDPRISPQVENESWLERKMINTRLRLGLPERPKEYYRVRGLVLYDNVDSLNWRDYFKLLQIPDTFHSWFMVTELHMWMLSVRANAEGKEGECLRKFAIEQMWENAYKRAKKLESYNASSLRASFATLNEEFQAAFVLYDYGLMGSDTALAEAVWYRLLEENCNDPERVDLLVKHIRKQVQVLDQISRDDFIGRAKVTWLPLSDKR